MAKTADMVIKIALNEVGYLEKKSNSQLDDKTANAGKNNYTKYARDLDKLGFFYNGPKNGYAWCDCFTDWVFVQAFGVEEGMAMLCQPRKSYGAGCGYSRNYYKNKGQFHKKNPVRGDQIFFWNASRTKVAHTGIVYDVDGTYVYTVEGNTSGASGVIANGGGVCKKKYKLTYSRICGYGRPKYDVVAQNDTNLNVEAPTTSTTTSVGKIDTIKEVQNWANVNYDAGLVVDGKFGKKSKKALIKILQKELNQTYKCNLVIDGSFGSKTKAACPNLKLGDKNDVVGVLQALLICRGYGNVYVDKSYGPMTVAAVKVCQQKNRLIVDGIAGRNTFAKLCK